MRVLTRRRNEPRRALFLTAGLIAVWCSRAAGQEHVDSLVLTPEQAVTYALDRNLLLKGARLGPKIAAWEVKAADAAWSPHFAGRGGVGDSRTPPLSVLDPLPQLVTRKATTGAAINQTLPWGSSYSVEWGAERLTGNSPIVRFNPQLTTWSTLTWTQHLLRGLTIDEARANRLISLKGQTVSEAELASSIAATRQAVLQAYWTWIYALEHLAVEQESLGLAQSLLRDDQERAELGKIAAVDVVEAEAEVARRSDVILTATRDVANSQDQVRLLIFAAADPEQSLALAPPPEFGEADLSEGVPADIIVRALESRQDLRVLQAYLDMDEVTVRRFRNERLPDVALSLSYASAGAAGSAAPSSLGNPGPAVAPRAFSSALGDVVHFRYPSWSAELSVSVPVGNSVASAEAAKASLRRTRDETTLRSAEQRVATEVTSVSRDVEANRQRLPLTANAVTLAERRLEAEQRKLVVGLSTSFLVFQAQRDLTTAREGRVKSMLEYRLSLADLEAVQTISVPR